MKNIKKNALLLTICSFFLTCCDFNNPGTGGEIIDPSTCEHSYVKETINPTCEDQGYTLNKCSKCEYSYKSNYKNALGHSYRHVNAREATFDLDGCVEHYECKRCDKVFDTHKNESTKEEIFNHLEIFDYKNTTDPIFLVHGPIEFEYDKEEIDSLIEKYDEMCEKIQTSSTTINAINDYVSKLETAFGKLSKAMEYCGLVADMYNRPEDYQTSMDITNSYYEIYTYYYNIFIVVGESSYKNKFYSGWSDSQIAGYVNELKYYLYSSGNEYELNMNHYVNEYKMGNIDAYTAISGYVKAANQYAKAYGKDNYVDFSYTYVYGREYSPSDTDKLKEYMVDYIIPYLNIIKEKYTDLAMKAYYSKDHIKANMESNSVSNNFFGNYLDDLTSYASFLGGKYEENYKKFFESGNYYFTNTYNDNITGYINTFSNGEQYMFLGRNYQSLTTFIHEFGHYNAGITYGGLSSYDLAEVQSQGNEMLFYSYLKETGALSELASEYFITDQLYNILYTIVYGYTINELEKYVYSNENFTQSELENKWIEIGESIGLDFSEAIDYMYTVLINYNVYYISYATSAIAALEVYAKAQYDINYGRESYISIYTKDSDKEGFSKSLTNAGLYSIFSKDAYLLIGSAIE